MDTPTQILARILAPEVQEKCLLSGTHRTVGKVVDEHTQADPRLKVKEDYGSHELSCHTPFIHVLHTKEWSQPLHQGEYIKT